MIVADVMVEEFESMENLAESLNGHVEPDVPVWDQLEEENPDFSFFADAHMDALMDYLTEGGFTQDQIQNMNVALYGPVVDFYHIGSEEDGCFIMAVGQR